MAKSIKEIADNLFGTEFPRMKLPGEELNRQLQESKARLQSREKTGKRKNRLEEQNTGESIDPCPKCGSIDKWDMFPDGRKYCLNCGAVKEIDGTVVGGAITKEITKGGETTMIEGELRCEQCGKVQPFSASTEELMEFIKQPHKNCGGRILFNAIKDKSKSIESKQITEASKQNMEHIGVPEKSDRCDHPKRDIFVCNNCPDFNYCSQKNIDAVICLLISIDLKLKKLLGK